MGKWRLCADDWRVIEDEHGNVVANVRHTSVIGRDEAGILAAAWETYQLAVWLAELSGDPEEHDAARKSARAVLDQIGVIGRG